MIPSFFDFVNKKFNVLKRFSFKQQKHYNNSLDSLFMLYLIYLFDNEVYSVTEEQLRQWLDEELAFLSYVTEGLLNICIEYIRKENGIIRV